MTTNKKKSMMQALLFLCFSIGAGVIEFGSFALMGLFLKAETFIVFREIVSVVLSCLFNFTLNRKYTFKSSNNIAVGMIMYGLFYLITTPLWAWAMKEVIASVGIEYELLVKAVKMLINFVLDFLYCKYIIFGIANKWKFNKMNKEILNVKDEKEEIENIEENIIIKEEIEENIIIKEEIEENIIIKEEIEDNIKGKDKIEND